MLNQLSKAVQVFVLALCFNCAFSGLAFGGGAISKTSEPVAGFEAGKKYAQGSVKVVDLNGTWHQMGRQYGKLMKSELHDVYFNKMEAFMKEHPEKRAAVIKIAEERYSMLPNRFKQIMQGMSETSSLNLEQVKVANAVEYASGITGCSALAVWQDYTKDKGLIYGRNYDFFPSYKKLSNDVVVAVYHPSDGSLSSVTVGYTGEIYAVNGFNEKGLFVEHNNGGPSDGRRRAQGRIHATISLMSLLFDADSLGYVDKFFNTVNSNAPYIIGVADKNEARAYEWGISKVCRGTDAPGKIVLSNHFTNVQWDSTGVSDATSWSSITRRSNMLSLAEKYKGRIDVKLMQNLLSRQVNQDGPMSELTVYQLIVEPQKRELWLKVVDTDDGWTKIQLDSFFKKTGCR